MDWGSQNSGDVSNGVKNAGSVIATFHDIAQSRCSYLPFPSHEKHVTSGRAGTYIK
jgi:hypothetical protein